MKFDHELSLDLLPLYAEGMLRQRNHKLMEEHISQCTDCQAALRDMAAPAVSVEGKEGDGGLKALRRRFRRHSAAVAAVTAFVVVLIGLLVWSLFMEGSDAMGYAFLAFYVILPLAGLACSLGLGLKPGKGKWLAPVVLGGLACLVPLLVFGYTEWTFFLFIFLFSALGSVIGHIIYCIKNRKKKAAS